MLRKLGALANVRGLQSLRSARDLELVLAARPVAEGTTKDELQMLLDALASPLLRVLDGSRDGGYRVTGAAHVTSQRLGVLAAYLSGPSREAP